MINERRRVDAWLSALGKTVGVAALALDANGVVDLALKGIPMRFFYDAESEHLALQAALGRLPAESAARRRLLRDLLLSNHLGVDTHDATLAVDATWKVVSLQKCWRVEPLRTIEAFLDDVACFLQVACLWQRQIAMACNPLPVSGKSLWA